MFYTKVDQSPVPIIQYFIKIRGSLDSKECYARVTAKITPSQKPIQNHPTNSGKRSKGFD